MSFTYKFITAERMIVSRSDGMFIPNSPDNELWVQFLSDMVAVGLLTEEQKADNDITSLVGNGTDLIDFINPDNITPDILDSFKASIDTLAGLARLRFITSVPGQEATYTEKADQAVDFKVAGYPEAELANYPLIQVEVNITGLPAQAACDGILARKALWNTKGAQIEEIRLQAKKDMSSAMTRTELQSILTTAESDFNAV